MSKKFTEEVDALLAKLGVTAEPKKDAHLSPREERILAGFEEIQRFVETHGHAPRHGEGNNIFERLYAARLDRLSAQTDCCELLSPIDYQTLLRMRPATVTLPEGMDDDALLNELGVDTNGPDITRLQYVRSVKDKRLAEEIATRRECADFDEFKALFEKVQIELETGRREAVRFRHEAAIEHGHFFILGGQKVFVAEKGEVFKNAQDRPDARLRLVFDNGTESNLLMRSLERALQRDEAGRRILETASGPLFADQAIEGDETSGTIYVLRSNTDIPYIVANRNIVHKIGVTNSNVKSRIAGAHLDPTFLMASVEIVAEYTLYNVNCRSLERLIHRIFDSARLDIEIKDRFDRPVVPREWFLVPLHAIAEAVGRIRDGSIVQYGYDTRSASFAKKDS